MIGHQRYISNFSGYIVIYFDCGLHENQKLPVIVFFQIKRIKSKILVKFILLQYLKSISTLTGFSWYEPAWLNLLNSMAWLGYNIYALAV